MVAKYYGYFRPEDFSKLNQKASELFRKIVIHTHIISDEEVQVIARPPYLFKELGKKQDGEYSVYIQVQFFSYLFFIQKKFAFEIKKFVNQCLRL